MTPPDATPATQPVFTAADDGFHFAGMGDRWWMTETSWFSFCHPERKLGGWLYTMARPNIGTSCRRARCAGPGHRSGRPATSTSSAA